MTLGGLALAVGILVDDSTVTIENTHRLLSEEKQAAARGDACTARPASPCRPSSPRSPSAACSPRSMFLEGPPKYLFTPLGLAVVFAMLASYAPVADADADHHRPAAQERAAWRGTGRRARQLVLALSRHASNEASSTCARAMSGCCGGLLTRRYIVPLIAIAVLGLGGAMFFVVGRDFYPLIDGGQIKLHVRAPAGTRLEATEQDVPGRRRQDPRGDSAKGPGADRRQYRRAGAHYNLAFTDGSTIAANDGVILVSLKEGHAPTADYVQEAARGAADRLPRV